MAASSFMSESIEHPSKAVIDSGACAGHFHPTIGFTIHADQVMVIPEILAYLSQLP
ncbi:MAG: hypothetical protein U0798_20180 [Gemmataceae bacterium]